MVTFMYTLKSLILFIEIDGIEMRCLIQISIKMRTTKKLVNDNALMNIRLAEHLNWTNVWYVSNAIKKKLGLVQATNGVFQNNI